MLPHPKEPVHPPLSPEQERLHQSAREHYARGNRFFDLMALDRAAEEWRRSVRLWGQARSKARAAMAPLAQARAVIVFLLTVLLVYNGIFTLFPRDPFEMLLLGGGGTVNLGGGPERQSWWDRWLDTGRPSGGGGDGERIGLREWWQGLRESWRGGGGGPGGGEGRGGRPHLDEHWEELLRRYGRWGQLSGGEVDYNIIAGYGLSRMGEYRSAVDAFERGIAKATRPAQLSELYQGLANTHYYEGYKLQPDGLATYNLALVKKATEAYELSTQYETRPLSYGNLGWMYFLLGDYSRAEMYSRRALQMDPTLEYVRLNLGLINLFQHRVEDSYRIYLDVIRRDPPDETYLGGINDLREVLRDHGQAYPFANLMLGLLALKSGRYTQAHDALSRFVAAPGIPPQWRNRGARLLRTMDIEEALR